MSKSEMLTTYSLENVKKGERSGNFVIDGRMIVNCILKKYGLRECRLN